MERNNLPDPTTKEKIEKYFKDNLNSYLEIDEIHSLLWIVLGEKDTALLLSISKRDLNKLRDFVDDFELYLHVREGSKRDLSDRISLRDSRVIKDEVFIARNKAHFDKLVRANDYDGSTARSIGEFLDYPESAINFYCRCDDPPAHKLNERVENWLENEKVEKKDLRFLSLVNYVANNDINDLETAIKHGKERKKVLEELDETFDFGIGRLIWRECVEDFESTDFVV